MPGKRGDRLERVGGEFRKRSEFLGFFTLLPS
jgi:hypothetical protein